MKSKDTNVCCSAEGHVSHVYADRMSSRPMGWCRTGVDKMSRLRIYRQNAGDILELVRFQQKELKQVAGAEEVIYSSTKMIRMEESNKRRLGVLAEMPVYSIPYPKIKK
jgi:endo-alpha-1,4-polygalactosaminidase (GH114 family)